MLPLRTLSDERLAQLAGMGHTEAFETLYERYRVSLARYCRSIVRDPDDAKDALQNTMLAVLNALRVNSPNGAVRPWMYRIAHNESISLIRRRRPHEELSTETPDIADTERGYASRNRLDSLLVDLRSLPDRQRGALVMRELSGLQYDEIGSALRTSPVAARKAVFEARVALHDLEDARETDCVEIKRRISDGDGRVLRGRGVRGHLRTCASCSAFERGLRDRRGTFALIPVFPVISAGALLGIALPGGGGGSTSGLALGGSAAAGGSLLGGGGIAAVKGIALGSAIAVAGAGVLVGTGINSHGAAPVAHGARVTAVHAPRLARAGVGTPALAHVAKSTRVFVVRTPRAPASVVERVASVTTSPTGQIGKRAVPSQPNASGPSAAVPGALTTPATTAPGPSPTPAGPTATATTPTSSPTASPTTTTPATGATATQPTAATFVNTIIQNALQAAGANLAAAEAQAGQALTQAGMAQGTAAATVEGILNAIFRGGAG